MCVCCCAVLLNSQLIFIFFYFFTPTICQVLAGPDNMYTTTQLAQVPLLLSYCAVTFLSIFQPIFTMKLFLEHKQGLGSSSSFNRNKQKKVWPLNLKIQHQALKGEYLERGYGSCSFDVCSGLDPRGSSWRGAQVYYLLPSILHGYLLHLARRKRRDCTAPLLLSCNISHYFSLSLSVLSCACLCFLNSAFIQFAFLISFNHHLYFVPSLCFFYLSQSVLFTSCLVLFSFFKNESTLGFSWRLSWNTKPQAKCFIPNAQVGISK